MAVLKEGAQGGGRRGSDCRGGRETTAPGEARRARNRTLKWTGEMGRPRISEEQKDNDGKDGDAVGEAAAARAGRTG